LVTGLLSPLQTSRRTLSRTWYFRRLPHNQPDGIKPGRPKGSLGSSKLDGKVLEIKKLLLLKVSKTSISKILEVNCSTLKNYVDIKEYFSHH
jgi:hypothetical protein